MNKAHRVLVSHSEKEEQVQGGEGADPGQF